MRIRKRQLWNCLASSATASVNRFCGCSTTTVLHSLSILLLICTTCAGTDLTLDGKRPTESVRTDSAAGTTERAAASQRFASLQHQSRSPSPRKRSQPDSPADDAELGHFEEWSPFLERFGKPAHHLCFDHDTSKTNNRCKSRLAAELQ